MEIEVKRGINADIAKIKLKWYARSEFWCIEGRGEKCYLRGGGMVFGLKYRPLIMCLKESLQGVSRRGFWTEK